MCRMEASLICVSLFIAYKDITLIRVGIFIAACAFEKKLKFGSFFRSFDFGLSVIAMLDDFHLTLNNILGYFKRNNIMFNRVILRFCTNRIDSFIKQIALARFNFSDCPVITANIFLCREFAVLIGCVGIN